MPGKNPDDTVSKNSNTSSPGRKPDQASPNPGGNKIHGDTLQPHPGQGAQIRPDEATPGPMEQNRPGEQRGKPDQRNNQPNNPDRQHRPENQKR
jgi:hypothetical protein